MSNDDEFDIGGRRWRGVVIVVVGFLALAGGLGFMAYRTWFAEAGTEGRKVETAAVSRGTIRATLASSGTVASENSTDLMFGSIGKVKTVDVKLGDQVQEGQVLATLEADDLENALATAQSALSAAQIKLRQLQEGATDADVAAADQAVATAQASLDKATQDYNDLQKGATSVELTAAEQAVSTAEASKAKAQADLDNLLAGPLQSEVTAAEANLRAAQTKLDAAQRAVDTAQQAVDSARTSMESAYNTYCADTDALSDICSARSIPLADWQVTELTNSLTLSTPPQLAVDLAGLVAANQTYNAANTALQNAEDAIAPAQDAVNVAQAKLDDVHKPPSDSTVAAARAGVDAAQAGVVAAKAKLDDLRKGASADQLNTAESAVQSAQAALASAQAKRAELLKGATPEDIDLQRTQVTQASLAVDKAQLALDKTLLKAPFAGTIGGVNLQAGEYVSATPAQAPVTLLSPDAVRLDLTIGEADLPNVHAGSVGGIIFDAIQGQTYPFVITAVGLSPKTQQGVVTYIAQAKLIFGKDQPKPAGGMTGAALIVQQQRQDIVMVPARAIRKRGGDQIVDVLVDGVSQERVVQTGLSDGTNTEITAGLAAGDTIELPIVTSSRGNSANPTAAVPGGIR